MNRFLLRLTTDLPMMQQEAFTYLLSLSPDGIMAGEAPGMKALREMCATCITVDKSGTATIPIHGALAWKPDALEVAYYGIEDSSRVTDLINEAANRADVKRVLLSVDSPGGMLTGGLEIGDAVLACAKCKPTVAHIGGTGASLGYLVASQASEVIANRSAVVGSIGVIASIPDYTGLLAKIGIKVETFTNSAAKYKAAGSMGTSLSNDQRSQIQSQLESAFQSFRSAVLATRPGVKDEAMQGQWYRGQEAKSLGLVDRIGDESFARSILARM